MFRKAIFSLSELATAALAMLVLTALVTLV